MLAIARATGLKPANVRKIKLHLFVDLHFLDRYASLGMPGQWQRFDSSLAIAGAWQRLVAGTHRPSDLQLLRHEAAESWYMRHVADSYDAAHTAAQRRFPAPERWTDDL